MPVEDEPNSRERIAFQYIWTNEPVVNQLKSKTEILLIKYQTIFCIYNNLGCKALRNTSRFWEARKRIVICV